MPRIRVRVEGVVQGVGFRPFIYRIARDRGLGGWVLNRPDGVVVEAEGAPEALEGFLAALEREAPAPARIRGVTVEEIAPEGQGAFAIRPSGEGGDTRPSVPADLAMCADCARELEDPSDRRHGYPFTNCTYCGPRFTIIEALPYDRPRTALKGFPLCPACEAEYRDPGNRRFHAQPVACPVCGPRLEFSGRAGDPLEGAASALLRGRILALKGLGGYQLLADATSDAAVARLRERKRREEKPFAVMFPHWKALEEACSVSAPERALLASPEAPILLLARRPSSAIVPGVAPGNPRLGAFLPYTPLHRLLLARVGRPVVCTSGNLSDEPMCHEGAQARERLGGIADVFLDHDRPILRPVDDSVMRLDAHGPTLLRRARGFAPLAHPVAPGGPPVLALGAHQKSTICLWDRGQAVVSQHLGDLHTADGAELLERTVEDFLRFFAVEPAVLACDLHPDYASTRLGERLARARGLPLARVQHHHAHVAALAAELGLGGPVSGLAWDGTGLGADGTLWGGEGLLAGGASFTRTAHLKPFPLPGGDRAARDPGRSALGLLWAATGSLAGGEALGDAAGIRSMLERGVNCPLTSSVGRLFDAVAALTGVRSAPGFEGQAAAALEHAALASGDGGAYPWEFQEGPALVADPAPLVAALLRDRARGVAPACCALRFHRALADLAVAMARAAGKEEVLLTGGCFQNALLTRLVREALAREGFRPLSPAAFPPNDGALSLGQAAVAAAP
ncbi:carbamoyltransferase HypF [Mesoterricola silvestris]|uniref:Carbamoyltransferase n=1 Tax=Mesoterricola silvestris TaxID=2927979 RepID=A0AA48KC79_9BACT|nr:carbamoyltransferase HypF [Mesoterricola silvestris]BDU73223.1 carbamoyltransferase HypF [Mesoterricola silvestris]